MATLAPFTVTVPAIKMESSMADINILRPYRTQKARGLKAAFSLNNQAAFGYKVPGVLGVLPHNDPETMVDYFKEGAPPIFARPCPITPRHGFVESRVVKNTEELKAVAAETFQADPEGEVIIMRRLTGKHSAVMTANGVVWGEGNDGVTSGRGCSYTIPAPNGSFDDLMLRVLGESSDNGVYVELVEDNGAVFIVQVRLGPKQPKVDLVRHVVRNSVVIRGIVQPNSEDLVQWDMKLAQLARCSGAVQRLVWLPGQTMSSHFAVQGVARGFNVSVEEECPVKPGQVLGPKADDRAPLTSSDYKAIARYMRRERKVKYWDFPRDVMLSVATLHSLPLWGSEPHLLALRARGVLTAARYGLAACVGEARHRPSDGETKVNWAELCGDKLGSMKPSRHAVFLRVFELPWCKCKEYAIAAAEDMYINAYPHAVDIIKKGGNIMDYKTNVMGPRWEWAALCVHDLIEGINRFCAAPNQDNWGVILGHYNAVINASHNGAYLLSKWCAVSLIDNAAKMPTLAFGYRHVMEAIWGTDGPRPFMVWRPIDSTDPEISKCMRTSHGVLVPASLVKTAVSQGAMSFGKKDADGLEPLLVLDYNSLGRLALKDKLPVFLPVNLLGAFTEPGEQTSPYMDDNGPEEFAEEESEDE